MELREIVERLLAERYPDANVALLAGSAARGEATATSDLDLVVLFDHLDAAFREAFVFDVGRRETHTSISSKGGPGVRRAIPSLVESLFTRGDIGDVVSLAEEVLKPDGGW